MSSALSLISTKVESPCDSPGSSLPPFLCPTPLLSWKSRLGLLPQPQEPLLRSQGVQGPPLAGLFFQVGTKPPASGGQSSFSSPLWDLGMREGWMVTEGRRRPCLEISRLGDRGDWFAIGL